MFQKVICLSYKTKPVSLRIYQPLFAFRREGQELLNVGDLGVTFVSFCLWKPHIRYFNLFSFLPLAFLRLLPMLTLNFGIPHTFLVLLNTFENFLQFFDNSKISLSFESKLQFFQKFRKISHIFCGCWGDAWLLLS